MRPSSDPSSTPLRRLSVTARFTVGVSYGDWMQRTRIQSATVVYWHDGLTGYHNSVAASLTRPSSVTPPAIVRRGPPGFIYFRMRTRASPPDRVTL
jgi:hypothetical protein